MGNSPKYFSLPTMVGKIKRDTKAVKVCYRVVLAKVVPLNNIVKFKSTLAKIWPKAKSMFFTEI